MANNYSLYPTIEFIDTSGIFDISSLSFLYSEDGKEFPLTAKEGNGGLEISDPDNRWTKEDYNLIIRGSVVVNKAIKLYGPNGIVCENASLGLSASWHSHDSNQRNVIEIGTLDKTIATQTLDYTIIFPKSTLRGILNIDICLFIKRPGTPRNVEKKFANYAGCLLGRLETYSVCFNGNGSVFPIYEDNKPGEPLWYVKCDFTDPSSDRFDENVYIYLNKAHDCYKYIDLKNTAKFNKDLLAEVLGNAIFLIVEIVKSYDEKLSCLDSPEEGSVAQALLYFQRTFEWDLSNPEVLTKEIRMYLSQKMK